MPTLPTPPPALGDCKHCSGAYATPYGGKGAFGTWHNGACGSSLRYDLFAPTGKMWRCPISPSVGFPLLPRQG